MFAVLTWSGALERARQSAPAVVAARMRVDEVRARATGAAVLPNPTVEIESGTESGIAIAQDLDLRRRPRIDAAQAAVRQEERRAEEVARETLRDVATAFLRAMEGGERVAAASRSRELASEALKIAERRYAAGDVAQLDVNLARTAVARAEADVRAAEANSASGATELQVLLGLDERATVEGSLHDELAFSVARADLRVLEEEIAEAEAEQRLAQAMRWPDVGVRGALRNEQGDRIVTAGVGFTLPFFQRGQAAAAEANARLARLRAERDALAKRTDVEVRGARATVDALKEAAAAYERTVIPLTDENEQLALESYEVGQIGLGDLLLVRREALDARGALIDRLIETRLAEVELRARAGAPQ
ncbi:MAG: TolC family protein [Acidobacteria bacterium]|nr:TolC family protein [Acidobacteriota bacterium]